MIEKVLIAEDDPLMLKFLSEILRRQGKEVFLAQDGRSAMHLLREENFDLILTDLKMPFHTGLEVLTHAQKTLPQALVVLMSAHGNVESAVEAMKKGAFNYLTKPFSPEALEGLLEKAEEHLRLIRQNRFYQEEQRASHAPFLCLKSPSMKQLWPKLEKIAQSQASVFITGESGTGKEVIAGAIHQLSSRKDQPFVRVNCAAIPESLLESEFFGHEKGAFTGAHMRKTGRFELADKGTLLLDEVTEIPLALQPKLLRAIQEQEFERVGGIRPLKVNIRFLATSNRNMEEAVETKVFREDLFYRLNVLPVHLPPLRERREDILPLANYFLDKFCRDNHKAMKTLTPDAQEKLCQYHWPGNIRELANQIERAVVLDFQPNIDSSQLYLDAPFSSSEEKPSLQAKKFTPGTSLHQMEKELILDTLKFYHQNRTKTAATLGISVRTLRNKLHEYELMGAEE